MEKSQKNEGNFKAQLLHRGYQFADIFGPISGHFTNSLNRCMH